MCFYGLDQKCAPNVMYLYHGYWKLVLPWGTRPEGRKGDHCESLREILDTAFIIRLIALL